MMMLQFMYPVFPSSREITYGTRTRMLCNWKTKSNKKKDKMRIMRLNNDKKGEV